jgi:hypothetical protein
MQESTYEYVNQVRFALAKQPARKVGRVLGNSSGKRFLHLLIFRFFFLLCLSVCLSRAPDGLLSFWLKMMFLTAVFPGACTSLLLLPLLLFSSSLFPSSWAAPSSYPRSANGTTSVYPGLFEATTEEVVSGLESGLFTSVDLVNVSFTPPLYHESFWSL